MFKKIFSLITVAIAALIVSACGGSSSGGSPDPTPDPTIVTSSMNNNNGSVSNGQINVVLRPSLGVSFSGPVNPITVNTQTVVLSTATDGSNPIALTPFTANNNNTNYSFATVNLLQANTKYYLIVNGVNTEGTQTESAQAVSANTFSFTTGASTIPMVSIINPENASVNNSTSPSIQIQFSESMINVNSGTVTLTALESNGTITPISTIIAGSNFTYTFSPTAALAEGTKYYVNISNNVTSADGNGNKVAATSFYFTTGDTSQPTVSMTSPSNASSNISTSQLVVLNFSEAVTGVESANLQVRESNVNGTSVPYTITNNGNNYTLTFTRALLEQTTYYVVASSGIKDLRNNALVPQTFTFTTGDFTNPTATLTGVVSNNATNVSRTPIITVSFSEDVLGAESNMSLSQIGGGTLPAESISITKVDNKTYTIAMANGTVLNPITGYFIVLDSAITDISVDKNHLSTTVFSFTTSDSEAPTVTLNTPANGSFELDTTPVITLQFSKQVHNVLPNQNVKMYRDAVGGEYTPITSLTDAGNNQQTINLPAPLDQGATYYLVVGTSNSNSILDNNDTPLQTTTFHFTIGDTLHPNASIVMPSNAATGVTTLPMIAIAFTESVINFESNIELIGPNGAVPLATPILGSNNVVTTYPTVASSPFTLSNSTLYTLYVKAGITDESGNALNPKAFTFTTGTSATPQVYMINPESGANPVGVSPTIQVRFSAAMDTNTLTNSNVALNNSGGVTTLTNAGNNIYNVNYNNIVANTGYTLSLSSSVQSLSFGGIVTTNFTFTTTDANAPVVTSTTPLDGATGVATNLSRFTIVFDKPVGGVTTNNVCIQESSLYSATWNNCENISLTNGNKGATTYTFSINNPSGFNSLNQVRIGINNGIYSMEPGTLGVQVAPESQISMFTTD